MNTPVLNKYLSKVRIFDISLSEEHCAAIDFNNNLYTWGYGDHGELGYYNENQIKVCEPLKVNIFKNAFLVNKIKCGKYYTAGITSKGIPFLFGNKVSKRENINVDSIIFFSFNYKFKLMAKDIYCGEDYIIILLEKEQLLIYSFNDGLFEIKLNNNNENINYFISKINIVDKNFYVLDERNKHLFEFIHYQKNNSKPFNIYDFYQNEYEVNPDIKLSIIEMPFFVKFLFFWIECSENQKKEFNSQNSKMFHKINEINFHYNCNKGPNINEYILFGNNRQKIELIKVHFENLFNKKDNNIIFKGEYIIPQSNKNNNFNTININININNNDSSFSSLNIPISKNYGNRNDIKDNNKSKLDLDIPIQSINNRTDQNINNIGKRKTIMHNNKYVNELNRIKYSISHDKKRTKINNSEYIDEEKEDNYSYSNLKLPNKKIINTKNIITIENNETINNMLIVQNNNKKGNNSFLLKNGTKINTNDDKQIEEKNDKNNYNHIQIRNSKNRSCSQIKEDRKHIYHNTSSITINVNNSKKEENEFDNILKDIDNRKLMLNQPARIEKNIINTKKVLSHIGKTKSKTEMLIKELQETFFGKENNNKYSNYYSNYKKINNNDEQKEEEIDDDNQEIIEKEIIKKEKEKEKEEKVKERIKKEEMKLRMEREERERKERLRIELEMKEKERIEKERKEKEKEELEKKNKLKKEREEREKKEKEERERIEREREIKEIQKREMEEKLRKEKEKREKERRDKEEQERRERERREKERKDKEEKERREREEKERKERERREREIKEKEEQERRERERIQKEIKEREEKERKEKEKKEREERERINKMRLEKEKLEKEIIEIRERKEKERLIKEKYEKDQKEKEELIKKQKILEEEEKRRKEELLEKDIRKKLENEYKQKYEKEKKRNEEEQKKEKEKLERIEKEKNEKLLKEKNKTLEKIKELEKKEKILMELEKEKKIKEEQRKNLLITSEINNFIEGKNKNLNKDKNNNYKFLPEKLRTENESEFLMKGIDKKNYNYTISGNQQINIENHQANKNINKNNLLDNRNINNNNELNFHIEDIVSTRDIIFDNNNNTSDKIDSLGEENKNFLNDLPLKLNKNKNENNHLKKVNNEKNFELNISNNNIINNNNKDENENALKFSIEDNNKINLYKSRDKEKEDSFELTNVSNKENIKEKENNNISDEDNDNEAPETVLELEEKQKKMNFNWKEKRKNRIREIIEEKQEFEMIQSIEDPLKNKDNKTDFNLQLPLPYNNDSEQPIITPVSEISTNNMRHISTYDQNIISSIRKFEPKELEDITGSLRIFSNRSENTNLLSAINNKNNNDKSISQSDNNNLNIISNKNIGINKNLEGQTSLKNDNLLNDSYKESNPNETIFKDQKMKIDDLEQSKNKFLNDEKNVGKDDIFYNNLDNFKYNDNILKEEIKNIKSDKVIRLKNEEELNYILFELKKLSENQNQNINESIYLILDNKEHNSNSNLKKSKIIKVKNNQVTTFESNQLDNKVNFKKELNFNYNNNNIINNLRIENDFNNNFILKNNSNNLDILPNNHNNINEFKYIKDIKNNKEIMDNNNMQIQNHKTLEEKSDFSDNKILNENNYERHTYVGNNNINIFRNNESPFNQFERHTNMIRGLQIKNMHTKNRSYGKDTHKKHKKKTGIIEQIKKEQSEKKNNGMFSTFNKRNKNIIIPNTGTPSSNIKKISKNSIAKIEYYNNLYKYNSSSIPNNINPGDNLNMNNHHNKSKSVSINNINKCLSCSPKKQHDDFLKYKINPQEKNEFYINNNNKNYILYNKDNNLNYEEEEYKKDYPNINYKINSKEENENNSLLLLRQKYLEFLIKIYGNKNIPQNKENEEMDNIFLKGLVRNEVPIENYNLNLNLLKCSNDMKNFISESLENFKLQQLKEKLSKVNDYKTLNLNYNIEKNNDNKNNNLNGLIQLDYEDEIKDKSNILEPLELDKSNFNLNFRKSFIESLSGIRNDNIFYRSEIIAKK